MPKKKVIHRKCNVDQYCLNISNQYLVLVTIFAAIISQEIENDEDLGILGSFLVALGEEISLSSETRIACKARFEVNENPSEEVVEDIFDRNVPNKFRNSNSTKKVKKIKKVKTNKNNKKQL